MKKNILILSILLLNVQLVSAAFQQPDPASQLVDHIKAWYAFPREEIILLQNKKNYSPGDTLWFKAYVLNPFSHTPSRTSNLLHVALMDGQGSILHTLILRYDTNGYCGYFVLHTGMTRGKYFLMAYTNWMKNFPGHDYVLKRVHIGHPYPGTEHLQPQTSSNRPKSVADQIRFFPESGHIVGDYTNDVAFLAQDSMGQGLKVTGYIQDDQGAEVTEFQSQGAGLGIFQLPVSNRKRFIAHTRFPDGTKETDTLPAAEPYGYIIHLAHQDSEKLQVVVVPGDSLDRKGKQAILLAISGGRVCYAATGTNGFAVNIPTADFIPGIAQLSLFNVSQQLITERLVFIPPPPLFQIHSTNLDTGQPGLSVRITGNHHLGKVPTGNYMLTAGDPATAADLEANNIAGKLLLGDEFKGNVPGMSGNPDPSNPEYAPVFEMLVMTGTWKGPSWKDILTGSSPSIKFLPELSQVIGGKLVTSGGKPVENIHVSLISRAQELYAWDTTNTQGRFLFSGLSLADSVPCMLSLALNNKEKHEGITIQLDTNSLFRLPEDFHLPGQDHFPLKNGNADIIKQSYKDKSVLLDTARVKAHYQYSRKMHASNVLTSDELIKFSDPIQALGMMNGVQIRIMDGQPHILINGNGSFSTFSDPLLVIDNVEFTNTDELSSLSVTDIDSIVVLRNADRYGSRGGNGAILVFMKKSGGYSSGSGHTGIQTYFFPGYEKPIATPVQEGEIPGKNWWFRQVIPDSLGTSLMHIPEPGNTPKNIYLVFQGVSDSGIPVFIKKTIRVQDLK